MRVDIDSTETIRPTEDATQTKIPALEAGIRLNTDELPDAYAIVWGKIQLLSRLHVECCVPRVDVADCG